MTPEFAYGCSRATEQDDTNWFLVPLPESLKLSLAAYVKYKCLGPSEHNKEVTISCMESTWLKLVQDRHRRLRQYLDVMDRLGIQTTTGLNS
jgi:hypothetical protein